MVSKRAAATESPLSPSASEEDFSLNAVGGLLEYRVPEVQRFNRNFIYGSSTHYLYMYTSVLYDNVNNGSRLT